MSSQATTIRLGSLCDLISAQVSPNQVRPDAHYLGLEHLASGRMRAIGYGKAADVQSHKFAFKRNDVLYGKLRPYLDKSVLADQDGICTTELLVLRAKPKVRPDFLACVVHAHEFIEHAMAGVTGAHHPRTSWSHISNFEAPQLDETQQAKFATALWTIHDLLNACEESEETLASLKSAAMRELFTRGLRGEVQKDSEIGAIPESWNLVDFKEAREWLQYGTSIHCTAEQQRYPVLRIPNIEPGRVNPEILKYCGLQPEEAEKYLLQKGDLLFIRTNGVLDRLGSCAVYNSSPKDALFASYLIRARLKKHINPKFVAYFYASDLGTELVAGRATPAADGKYNLNTGTIDSLPLPLPVTEEEQREIVEILEAIDCKIDLHKRKRAVLEELFRTLLHKLMTGEVDVNDLDLSAIPATNA